MIPHEVAKNWFRFEPYFEFWRDFVKSGDAQVRFCFNNDLVGYFADFFLDDMSPIEPMMKHKHQVGNQYTCAKFSMLVETIWILVSKTRTREEQIAIWEGYKDESQCPQKYRLTKDAKKCMHEYYFYHKAMKENQSVDSVINLVGHFAYDDDYFCKDVITVILKGFNNNYSIEDTTPYLRLCEKLLMIGDSNVLQKFEWTFGFPEPYK